MKHILYIIPIILFGCNFSSAEEHSFDHELMPPDSIHIRRSTEGHAPLLKSLLEQNDLKAFYQHAKTVLTAINKLQHEAPWNDDAGRGLRHALEPLSDQRSPHV